MIIAIATMKARTVPQKLNWTSQKPSLEAEVGGDSVRRVRVWMRGDVGVPRRVRGRCGMYILSLVGSSCMYVYGVDSC